MEILRQILIFFQDAITSLTGFTEWLWTPWDGLTALTGVEIAPIAIFSSAVVIAIIGFHIAHLVNIVTG